MIKRELYIKRIKPFINSDLVKVLTGFRRSGKSVMLELLKKEIINTGVSKEQIISYNFESLTNAEFCSAQKLYAEVMHKLPKNDKKVYLFLDEIQEVTEWEKCINSLRVDCNCDIYITGSNAKLLSGELATYLGGRYVEFKVYPFSFGEYLRSINIEPYVSLESSNNTAAIKEEFRNYVNLGGMPFLSNIKADEGVRTQYLSDIFKSVVLKDILMRNKIRDADMLERVITFVIANVGHTFSARSIAKYLKSESRSIAPETVLNYISACCNAFLFYKAPRHDIAGKKLLSINEKYYMVDHGLRQALYGNNERDIEQVLENIVYMELLRRGYLVQVGQMNGKEIDFIAVRQEKKLYVQVSYLLESEETQKREFGVFRNIDDNYPKYVVSMDEINLSRNGIIHCCIWNFLLSKIF